MTRVLVTGCEQSGTGAVATVLREAGADVVHLAVPHVHDWSAWRSQLRTVDRAVVVVRGLLAHAVSLTERSGELKASGARPLQHRRKAFYSLSFVPFALDPLWVTYESLAEPLEVRFLCEALGLDPGRVRSPIQNRNLARYAALAEGAST